MADISITASALVASTSALAKRRRCILGATLIPGDLIYLDTGASNVAKAADNNGASSLIRTPVGMLLTGGVSGQPAEFITEDDDLTLGTHGVAINTALVLADTAGKIMPLADLDTEGMYGRIIGFVKSATKISFSCPGLEGAVVPGA
jgi:hypothetical protein